MMLSSAGVEHQGAPFHPLGAALLLIPGPLQAPVDRGDLCTREPLRVDDALSSRSLLPRVQLGHPNAQAAVGAAQPFEGGIGQEMGSDAGCGRSRSPSPGGHPTRGPSRGDSHEQLERAHSRSHPLRRNQR